MSMRCDWRYGAWGPPTSGPSSQSMPSQRIASRSCPYDSSESRAASVSSMRKTRVPWWWRAKAQLNRAVRTRPTWGLPVGDGQKRTRTGEPGALATLDNLVGESADAFDADGDLVADSERADPCRGAREDHVAGEQRHGLGDVDDQILDGVDHLARTAELALRAVDRELDGQVARVEVGLHPGAERAGGVEALGPGPLLLALLDVTGGDVVGAGVAEDHVLDAFARDLAAHP